MDFLRRGKYLAVGLSIMFMAFCCVMTLWFFYDLAVKYFGIEYFIIAGGIGVFIFLSYNIGVIAVEMKEYKDNFRNRP
jgi:hypothetical protein